MGKCFFLIFTLLTVKLGSQSL